MLVVLQIIISLLLIVFILLQAQGTGLSGAFGGSGEFFRSKKTIEKLLFKVTIFLSIIFGTISILLLFIR